MAYHSRGGHHVEPGELGLNDPEMCREMEKELGGPPPWQLSMVKSLFDTRYPGWDDAPGLPVSSPVGRLRHLADTLSGGDDGVEDALRELGDEVTRSQLRLLNTESDNFHAECCFLLVLLDKVGVMLLTERDTHRHECAENAKELTEAHANARKATVDAIETARDEAKGRMEELATEVDLQQRRCEQLQRALELAQDKAEHADDLERHLAIAQRESTSWKQAHDALQEDLREVKAQKAALAVAHEESECVAADLGRRLEIASAIGGSMAGNKSGDRFREPQRECRALGVQTDAGLEPAPAGQMEAFAKGAHAALALSDVAAHHDILRPAILAWRCARLEGKTARFDAAAAAKALEAEKLANTARAYEAENMALANQAKSREAEHLAATAKALEAAHLALGTDRAECCCIAAEHCCRSKWLEVALRMLQRERARADHADRRAAVAATKSGRLGFLALSLFIVSLIILFEPYLDGVALMTMPTP
eukprot:gnl/TRDRNA2_/TRDRNA2_192962_c0_seq1.p1 gnl/TRDRNA2_/TRDRNA2_192962_c0~~gnl/TRDRNA2_/TRDRNA2_192962_c0_seq1.p1  ORF type:complete len:482 (+),score=110.48 gnl/TRDRNA2_/TRDRNA2_192962_c0_seq1:84-1529(+)